MRLGKIEKYLLTWSFRYHESGDWFLSKSGALLSFARHELGIMTNATPRSVKAVLPDSLYRKLHVSFHRALVKLEKKGLTQNRGRAEIERIRGRQYYGIDTPSRREAFYALTAAGRAVASKIHRTSAAD